MMIPKIIHYVWLGGGIPAEYKKYIDDWKKLMPDYKIVEWNEKNFDFSQSDYAMQAYKSKKYGFVADYIRVCVLEQYGGIYLDTDVEVLKRFDDLLNQDFFTCYENDVYVETAVLGCVAHHPIMTSLKRFYQSHAFIKNGKIDDTPNPLFFTYFLAKDYGFDLKHRQQTLNHIVSDKTATIYENEYFAPINYFTNEIDVTENTYAIHHFAASWVGKKGRLTHKFTRWALKTFGNSVFAFFTRCYVKHIIKKIWKEDKKHHFSYQAQTKFNS